MNFCILFVLNFNAAPYFQLKKLFFIVLFLNNAKKSCAPFMEFFFLHDKFLHGKALVKVCNL